MNAYLALAIALSAPALALTSPRDRFGYEREIDTSRYYQVPKLLDYVLNENYLSAQKSKAKLVTKLRPEEAVAADNVILQSNVVKITKPTKKQEDREERKLVRTRRGYNLENVIVPARYAKLAKKHEDAKKGDLVRTRRGYNLENVIVPARYPYQRIQPYNRFRRWG